MLFFQSLFGRRNRFPFDVNVPVIIVFTLKNYTVECTPSQCYATIVSIIIPTLVGFVQILSNNQNMIQLDFPFNEPSIGTTMTCIFSLVLYYLASRVRKSCFPYYTPEFGIVMDVSASICVASLVSLIVPHSWWLLRYLLYILLFLVELHHCLRGIFHKYFGRFFFPHQRQWCRMNEHPLLPHTYMDIQLYGNLNHPTRCVITQPVQILASMPQVNIDVSN
ncbi:hypothetical protein VNO77_07106 [Canavalia gladiata]|uniref:Uncharacterized protein n=1 Tax=Canavalia gladiata TaxID=3824 RepID=A0AAN9MCU5_CANGL